MAKDSKKPANHLRAWREFRGLTQEKLAELADTKGSTISLLESGDRGLSDKWLRRFAPILKTSPGFLMDHDPNNLDTSFIDAWNDIPPDRRAQALAVIQTFRRTGTED